MNSNAVERFLLEKKDILILLVDDSPTQLFEAKYYLEKEGYEVVTAVDGVEALKVLKDTTPTLVITDIVMPNLDGYGLCEKIKEDPKNTNIPVVLLTSLSDPKDIVKSIKSGANKFITKPLDIEKMNSVIAELMFNQESRKKQRLDVGIKILFEGEEHTITSDKVQLLDLLISSYESAYSKNRELIEAQNSLEKLNLELESKVQQRTQEIKDQALQNQLILDSAGDGIFGIDNKGKIYFVNKKAYELLGYEKQELLGKYAKEVIKHKKTDSDKFIVEDNCKMIDTIKTAKTHIVDDEMFHVKNDGYINVEYTVSPIELEDGLGAVVVFRDVSEKIKLQEQIKQKDKMLLAQSRQAAMGDMLAMIAHQWRQPISTISMIANNVILDVELESEIKNENLKKDMENIGAQTQHLSNTIDDFRNFFKPNKEKIKTTMFDILKSTLFIVGKSLENNNVNVIFDENNIDKSEILTYDKELKQVFLNILSNSKDAIVSNQIKDGTVKINIEKNDSKLIVSLCDNGGGIPEKIIDRLGEPYLTTKNQNGTGLGLYMSKMIVEKHLKGKLYWTNKDKGACFFIEIPV